MGCGASCMRTALRGASPRRSPAEVRNVDTACAPSYDPAGFRPACAGMSAARQLLAAPAV
jgi:hypothetical protein